MTCAFFKMVQKEEKSSGKYLLLKSGQQFQNVW